MNLSRSQLARVISAQTISHGIDKTLPTDIARILLKTKKTHSLNSLMRDVERNWAELGYIDVIAKSAFPLSDLVKKDIKHLINSNFSEVNHIKIIEVLDSSVVAGVVLEFPDQKLDLSIENKINQFKQFAGSRRKDS
ncbi:MAG TPA: F0F1 ATP synthase subunit delta [Candidatus Dormibacteraeota bacterium]|nr:F0F1 ATP synthase subunit delta [Candidatus Dormibacteraeota bacterium]